MLFWGLVLYVKSSPGTNSVAGFLVFGVSHLLIGLMLGSGRYRGPRDPWEK
jgi:hypothetical protein